MKKKRLVLLLDSSVRGPLVRRWLSRTADLLKEYDLDLVAIGGPDVSSSHGKQFKSLFYYFLKNYRENNFFWRLREKKFFDCCCNLTGSLIEGPRLSRLNEPAPKEKTTTDIQPESPLLWWREAPPGLTREGWVTLLGIDSQPPHQRRRIVGTLNELQSVSGLQIATEKMDYSFSCSEQLELEFCRPDNITPTDFTWLLDGTGANVVRTLDQLRHAPVIAERSAPWTGLLGTLNKKLLYPVDKPLFGVEVLERLTKDTEEKNSLIRENREKLNEVDKRAYEYVEENFLKKRRTGLE